MECKTTSLCLFDRTPIQTDIIRNYVSIRYPQTSIDSGSVIEFLIPGNDAEYIDVNDINLHVKFKIVNKDGTNLDDKDKVAVNNLAIATLFKDVSLTIGETRVEGGQHSYPYLGYFSTVMQFQPQAQKSHMAVMGWCKDEAGKFDSDKNKGFVTREKWTAESRVCELYGPLYLDFFRQSRFLMSKVDMRVHLLPNDPKFVLNSYGAKTEFKIVFESVRLYVRRMTVNPSVINGHEMGLKKYDALYDVNHTEIHSFTIPRAQKSFVKDSLFPIQSPKMIIVGLIANDAYNGNISKNPLNFEHFGLNQIGLYRDTDCIPGTPFCPDFANGHYSRSYQNTMETFKYWNTDDTNGLTYDEFAKGYTLYAFDLTANNEAGASYRPGTATKGLKLEFFFEKDLTKTVNVLIYAVFDSTIRINRLRDVSASYTS